MTGEGATFGSFGQMRSFALEIFALDCSCLSKIMDVNYNAGIPENHHKNFVSWQNHLGLLWRRLVRRYPMFPLLLGLRCFVVNRCFPHGYETTHTFTRRAFEERQIQSCNMIWFVLITTSTILPVRLKPYGKFFQLFRLYATQFTHPRRLSSFGFFQ